MNGDALLDTNLVIGAINQDSQAIAAVAAVRVFVPTVVVGELYYGAFKSVQVSTNLARIRDFLPRALVLDCDMTTAEHYGRLKSDLRAIGRPIPENDLWIAAVAVQHQLPILSRDAHFDSVAGLTRIAW